MNSTGDRDGLMGTILALTSPPTTTNGKGGGGCGGNQKKGNKSVPKEVYCDSCGDTGDVMLTCSDCHVVSYHPLCDDPPLDEDKVKDLNWQCRQCRNKPSWNELRRMMLESGDYYEVGHFDGVHNPLGVSDSEEENDEEGDEGGKKVGEGDKPEEVQEVLAGSSNPAAGKEIESGESSKQVGPSEQKTQSFPKKRQAQVASSGAGKENETPMQKKTKGMDTLENRHKSGKLRSMMKAAVTVAKCTNPAVFELPPSFTTQPYNFPGTSRSSIKKPPGTKPKLSIVDLENFCVPKPLSKCFKCGMSCRVAALLQCDYCPKMYHFDCLTPPLTCPPVGLWMCPLHAEPLLEKKLLHTTKLSDRVALWDFTHKQMDRTAVTLKFLEKCSRPNPPFARKIAWPKVQESSVKFKLPSDRRKSREEERDEKKEIFFLDKQLLDKAADTDEKKQMYECYDEMFEEFSALDIDELLFDTGDSVFNQMPLSFSVEKLESETFVVPEVIAKPKGQVGRRKKVRGRRRSGLIAEGPVIIPKVEPNYDDEPMDQSPSPLATTAEAEFSLPAVELVKTSQVVVKAEKSTPVVVKSEQTMPVVEEGKEIVPEKSKEETPASTPDFKAVPCPLQESEIEVNVVVPKAESLEVTDRVTEVLNGTEETPALNVMPENSLTKPLNLLKNDMAESIPVKDQSSPAISGLNLLLQAVALHEEIEKGNVTPEQVGLPNGLVNNQFNRSMVVARPMPVSPPIDEDPLLELLFVDQKMVVSICKPQVIVGTQVRERPNTVCINPLRFTTCPRLSTLHAVFFFDVHKKQWEVLNYSQHGLSVDGQRLILKSKPKKASKPNALQAIKEDMLRQRKILIEKQRNFHVAPKQAECCCYEQEMQRCRRTVDDEGSAVLDLYSQIQIGCLRMIVTKIWARCPPPPTPSSALGSIPLKNGPIAKENLRNVGEEPSSSSTATTSTATL